MVFRSPISIITGGPGTGKTTVLKVILYIHKEKYKTEVQLMAPTGRAARRMAESTGHEESSTMHMALGLYGDDEYEPMLEELSAEFVNVDEFSMVDMHLAYEFFSKVKPSARVLLVGDIHQLPSVGAGEVFRQLILCGKIPVTTLDLVYRQGKNSNIALNAKLMQQGRTDLIEGEDFQMIACKGAEEAAQIVKELYVKELAVHGMDQVQILSPYKVRSAAGVIEINRTIQDVVNPPIRKLPVMGIWGFLPKYLKIRMATHLPESYFRMDAACYMKQTRWIWWNMQMQSPSIRVREMSAR